MPPAQAPTVADYVLLFRARAPAPRLTAASLTSELPFIGAFYAHQMANHASSPVSTVGQLVQQTRNKNLPQIRQLLAEFVRNRSGNKCVRGKGARGNNAYHVRDFNHVAFNSLRNALYAARQVSLGGAGRANHASRLPTEITGERNASTAECGCRQTRATCQQAGAAACRWKDIPAAQRGGARALAGRSGVCQPVVRAQRRGGRTVGDAFPGIRVNEPGQKRRRGQRAAANQTFVGQWRVPDV